VDQEVIMWLSTMRCRRWRAICLAVCGFGLLAAAGRVRAAVIIVPGPGYSSRVDATITPSGAQFMYAFEVFNTSGGGGEVGTAQFFGTPVIMDWELPLFSLSDLDVNSIVSPLGWQHEIVSPHTAPPSFWNYVAADDPLLDPGQGGDPNLYGPNPHVFENPPFVLHWFTDDPETYGIFPGNSLGGFGFLSDFSPLNAPYLASWVDLPPRGGDPPIPGSAFGTPNSPARQIAQQPEPSTILLAAMCGLGLMVMRRKLGLRARSAS